MGRITDYDSLKTEVSSLIDRGSLYDSDIPLWVQLGESRIRTDVRVRNMETKTDLTLDSEFVTLPSDFIEMRSVQLSVDTPYAMYPMDVVHAAERDHWSTGKPKFYAIHGDQFQSIPTPDSSYTAEIIYVAAFDALDTTSTNWLLTNYPDVYLFATLIAAEPWIGNDARTKVWVELYKDAVKRVNGTANEGRWGPGMQARPQGMTP